MFENCVEIRGHFSDYLDDLCSRETLRSIRFHLTYCASCEDELDRWQQVAADLRALPRRPVPPELALRLRVRLSQQLHRNLLGWWWVWLENALQPLVLPASAGLLTAVVFFGLIMGSQVVPVTSTPDVPLGVFTPPRIRAFPAMNFSASDQAVVVVTHIDAGGRVMTYKVLAGQRSPEMMQCLDRMMYFSLFDPATTSGKPTDGQMVLSLRRITVRG